MLIDHPGIAMSVSEASILPMNRKLWIEQVLSDGEIGYDESHHVEHDVFFVHMNFAERYALDLTCAQYGHFDELLMPWATFVETRCLSTSDHQPLGHAKEGVRELVLKQHGPEGLQYLQARNAGTDVLTNAVASIPDKFGAWIKILKQQDEEVYRKCVEQITEYVTQSLNQAISTNEIKEGVKLWHSRAERRAYAAREGRRRQEKVKTWGEDFRGPAYHKLLAALRKKQKAEKDEYGTPEEERKQMEYRVTEGTRVGG